MLTRRFTGAGRADPGASLSGEEARKLTAALADREAAIVGLEQTIDEQQARIATLEAALERAKFQAKIREQSYSMQLSAACERAAAAERLGADQQARLKELEADHGALTRKIAEAQPVRESMEVDAESIDAMLASFELPQEPSSRCEAEYQDDSPTDSFAIEEMLPPDVMFAGKGGSER